MRRRWGSRLALGVGLVALPLAACGDDDDADAATTSSTTTTTEADDTTTTTEATTTTLSAEAEVLESYQAALSAFSAAANPPDPEHPDLLAHYAGDALTAIQDRLRNMQAQGVAALNTVESHPTVVSFDSTVAQVEDCFIDRTQIVIIATGERGQPDETVAFLSSRMELIDGSWKVTEREGREEPCTPA